MIRSLLTAALAAVLALGATACGGDDSDDASSTPSESASSTGTAATTPSASSTAPSGASSGDPSESAAVPGDEGEEGPDGGDGNGGEAGDAGDAAVVSSMQASLNALVDQKTTPQQKADRVVGGRDLASVFEQFERGSGDSRLAFTVEAPEVEGRRATALVGATDRGRPFAVPARTPFVLADGEWRLERRTVCVFAEQAGLSCP